jgi:hypothetical protein
MVAKCDVMVVVIGRKWLEADESGRSRLLDTKDLVRTEVSSALRRDIPVIPVLVGSARIPDEEMLPDEISPLIYRQAIEVGTASFHAQIQNLIKTIETVAPSGPSGFRIWALRAAPVVAILAIGLIAWQPLLHWLADELREPEIIVPQPGPDAAGDKDIEEPPDTPTGVSTVDQQAPGIDSNGTGPDQFRVVALALDSASLQFSGSCPITVDLSGDISAIGSGGDIFYAFSLDDGRTSAIGTVQFDSPSTQAVGSAMTFDRTYEGTVALRIFQPEELESVARPLQVQCRTAREFVVSPTSNLVASLKPKPLRTSYLGTAFEPLLLPTWGALEEFLRPAELQLDDIETIEFAIDLDSIDFASPNGPELNDKTRAALGVELRSPISDNRLNSALAAFAESVGLYHERVSHSGRGLIILRPVHAEGGLSIFATLAKSRKTVFLASSASTLESILEREDSGEYVDFSPFRDTTETDTFRAAVFAQRFLLRLNAADPGEMLPDLPYVERANLSVQVGTTVNGTINAFVQDESPAWRLSEQLTQFLERNIFPNLPSGANAVTVSRDLKTIIITVRLTENDLLSFLSQGD